MSTGIIYLIINKQNGRKYVGQTTQGMNKKWQQHIQEALRMSNEPLHRAMRKYGNHNFMIKELDECDESLLDKKEQYWIEKYNTSESSVGYNNSVLDDETEEEKNTIIEKPKREPWGFLLPENRGNGSSCGIQMLGLNIETGEEIIWESASDAAAEVANNPKYAHNILRAADNGWKAYGYRWRRLGKQSNKIKVYGVHKRTWERTPVYESIRQAAKMHGDTNKVTGICLTKSLKNPNKYTWKGYYWFKA